METVYAADKNVTSFDVSWEPHDGAMDSSDASNVYIMGLDEATTYTFFGWAKNTAGISENSADASATTIQNIPDSPAISLNDVSFTSMTVHMETVYADNKNVTSFDVSWSPADGVIDSSDASNVYITDLVEATTYTFFGWVQNSAGISETSADASATTTTATSSITYLDVIATPIYVATNSSVRPSENTLSVTNITGDNAYANGTYIMGASVTAPLEAFYMWKDNNSVFYCDTTLYSATGDYNGLTTMTAEGITYSGEWNQIHLPYQFLLKSYNYITFQDANTTPKVLHTFGSLDGTTWNLIGTVTRTTTIPSSTANSNVSTTLIASSSYNYIRFLVASTFGSGRFTFYRFNMVGDVTTTS
jgi:hypothetical protein